MPQATTQSNDTEGLGHFLERDVNPLGEKVLALVIQPSMRITIKDGRELLNEVLRICDYQGYRVVLQFNHYSWFQDLTYHMLEKYNAALAWTETSRPLVTSDFLYLRINDNERT